MANQPADPKAHNRKRSRYISLLKNKNFKLYRDMQAYQKINPLDETTAQIVETFNSQIFACSNISLYSEEHPRQITYIASNTCKNKCCFICNWNRQKAIRRKYISWFRDNQTLNKVIVSGKRKVITNDQLQALKNISALDTVSYDLMHLTLTVPHYLETGFNGDKYYYSRIIELFNFMRKDKEWLSQVYGGEFGVETTNTKGNGLHIHIHALLLVAISAKSRNQLHAFILDKWNRLTVNKYSPRLLITPLQRAAILKGNCDLTDQDIDKLNPQGSTEFGLETIYSMVKGVKVRTTDFSSPEMMKAIMEAISYHFEPHAFNKDDKEINIPLLIDILPQVKGKILYKKFGCLHGEKRLNITYKDEAAEMLAELDEVNEMNVNPETGELTTAKDYFVLNPAHVCHDNEKDNNIFLSRKGRKVRKMLNSHGTFSAVKEMSDMVQRTHSGNGGGKKQNNKKLEEINN